MEIIDKIKNNYIYILWFLYNLNISFFIVGFSIQNFLLILVIYTITIIFALSNIGEKLLRFLENIRSLETKKEREYLIPLFDEVYKDVILWNYNVKEIEICIVDAMYINAFALGKQTIAVTTGAINSLTEEEIKGLIAHEIGHIVYGHTIAKLLSTIGNGILIFIVMISKMIINAIEILHSKYNKRGGIIELLIFIVKTIFDTILFLFVNISELILSINSRENEYEADKFAFSIGYGEELKDSLYLLQEMIISDKASLFDKLKRSHPNIAKRIGALEALLDE